MSFLMFIWGAVFGSAANALIDRLPKGESWLKGNSKCDKCKHKLNWYDLVPIISYVYLTLNPSPNLREGKRKWYSAGCRYCHSPIPVRNLLVELFLGTGFLIFSIQYSIFNIQTILLCGILWVTTIIAVMDWETKLVSEAMVGVWAGLVFLANWGNFANWGNWGGLIIGVGVIGGIWAVTRGKAMGEGDIEIAAVLGWWLGWQNAIAGLWLAFVTGSIYGGVLLIARKAKLKSEIAFGPFLVLGAWIAFFWGDKLWKLVMLK